MIMEAGSEFPEIFPAPSVLFFQNKQSFDFSLESNDENLRLHQR